MKEITRIHIAKTAYDIELAAKKELETYIGALERYAEDPSILEDIEIRITELLLENGTTKDDVITMDDVTKLRKRLGEPQDFAEDSEVAALPADVRAKTPRRLYRDQDKAVIGGVLSGVATYLGINPLWTRLFFLVLLLGSFGTMAIVYVVLWIAVPQARTAAEKLELEGKPVTLAAIKERSERIADDITSNQSAQMIQKVLMYSLGIVFSLVAIGSLLLTIVVGSGFFLGVGINDARPLAEVFQVSEWIIVLALGLFIVSGLLFTALNAVLAVAAFARTWTKRISVSVAIIVISGIVAFSGGVGAGLFGHWYTQEGARQSMTVSNKKLSAEFANVKKSDY